MCVPVKGTTVPNSRQARQGKDQVTTEDSMGGGTRYYDAPKLASQLVERATEEVQGSSSSDIASAVVMMIGLVQHFTKPNQGPV